MNKKIVLILILYFSISACGGGEACKDSDSLEGRYSLKLDLLVNYNNGDSSVLILVKKNNWEKVELVVSEHNYHFEKSDDFFKKYEGTWEYKSIGFDGDCYVYINQKEASRKIPLDPFNIAVFFSGKTIILPFKKE